MANLKEIRNRINSVSSTMQITSAMKMVSAAKLKKAQDAITAMRPYAEKLTELIQNISATLEENVTNVFAEQRPVNKVLLVVVTSNRGLCGAFNANVLKKTKERMKFYADKEVEILTIGKKAHDILSKSEKIFANESQVYDELTFENVADIAQVLMDLYVNENVDRVEILYNQFKNAASQVVMTEQFLPLEPIDNGDENAVADYIFEPSKEEIINSLIPSSLKTQLFKALLDSNAAEHGARMTAMHKATDNAEELRDQLKLTYNKARQAAITNEILEIVGGAEALNG